MIIPVYRNPAGLRRTLESLKVARMRATEIATEIIVVNDGGVAAVTSVCAAFDCQTISVIPRSGSYASRNRGIELARFPNLAFVDADISVPPNWLSTGAGALRSFDYVGGPVRIDSSMIRSVADQFEKITAFNTERSLEKRHNLPTANLFIKKDLVAAVGPFDERLESGGDVEFGDRVYRAGGFAQGIRQELAVLHPPRGFNQLVSKARRVETGQAILRLLYPARFTFLRPTFFSFFRKAVGPTAAYVLKGRRTKYGFKPEGIAIGLWLGVVGAASYLSVFLRYPGSLDPVTRKAPNVGNSTYRTH